MSLGVREEMADEEFMLIGTLLTALYGARVAEATLPCVVDLVHRYADLIPAPPRPKWSERDAILICYPDQVREPPQPPLQVLLGTCRSHLADVISTVHLLPFYPSSSDEGFSVLDYRQVDPAHGTWDDIHELGRAYRLMFDAVVNHVSAGSAWFEGFLRGEAEYADFFITPSTEDDLSAVIRPRTSPLLTSFQTSEGERSVWTTFSADQIDLNYRNPQVLLEIVDLLLYYASRGAALLRLDAVAFLWKQPGTTCLNLPQTHLIVRLFRAVLDVAAPHVRLITETNVPHQDNIGYFGDGVNEAQMVYNFALAPLVLDALALGSASVLTTWAAQLKTPGPEACFLNFLASHDGIGLNPARGLISEARIQALSERAQAHGGHVSYRSNPDGSTSAYELNINYFDALSDPDASEPMAVQVDRFMVAYAVMLCLAGVPGIYFHSLFGSRGWSEGVRQTGRPRTINRQRLERRGLEQELGNPDSLRARVFTQLSRLLRARGGCAAFHPNAGQRVLDLGEPVFGLVRTAGDTGEPVVCAHNMTDRRVICPPIEVPEARRQSVVWADMLTRSAPKRLDRPFELAPYQVAWLRAVRRRASSAGATSPGDEAGV